MLPMDQIEDQEISTKNQNHNGGKQRRKGSLLRSTYYRRSETEKSKAAAAAAVVSAAESSAEELSMDFSAELKHAENGNESLTYPHFTASGNQKQEEEDTDSVYYFGYGPIVNPLVRQRRGFGSSIIPEANIQPAILYDHRLQFIEGGTANIIPCRGWDVKGVLIQFHSVEEFHQFHSFDLNYDIHDVSVSLINKTNLDPKHKNDSTAPFEGQAQQQAQAQCQQGHRSEGEGVDKRGHESYGNSSNSCPDLDFDYISEGDEPDPNDVDEDEDKDDYNSSCPFAVTGGPSSDEEDEKQRRHSILGVPISDKSLDLFGDGGKKEEDEATVVHAVTFMNLSHRTASLAASSPCQHRFDSSQTSVAVSTRGSTCSTRTNTSTGGEGAVATCPLSVVGMPQERYLKLMTEGLRQYDIDEEYINDEIMVVAYVPKERDAIVSCQENNGKKGIATTLITTNYRTFPVVKVKEKEKEPKEIGYNKYVMKLCGSSRSINKKHTLLGAKPQQQQQQDFYFICGHKVLKLIPDPAANNTVNGGDNTTTNEGGGPSVANNACVRWIKGLCHGKQDVTYLVYQTFFDPDNCQFVIEEEDTITAEHTEWAEHTLLLYLQRGGLSAVQVYKLSPTDQGPSATASRGTTPTTFSGHSSMNRSSLMKTLRSTHSGSKHSITSTGSNGSGGGMIGHGSGGTHASSSIRISAMNRMKSMKLSSSRNGLRSSTIGDDVISHGANNKTWGSSASAQFQVSTTGSRTHHHRSPSEIPMRNNIGRDDISGSQLYHNHGGEQDGGGRISSLSSSSNSKTNLGLSLRKKLLFGLGRSSKK